MLRDWEDLWKAVATELPRLKKVCVTLKHTMSTSSRSVHVTDGRPIIDGSDMMLRPLMGIKGLEVFDVKMTRLPDDVEKWRGEDVPFCLSSIR